MRVFLVSFLSAFSLFAGVLATYLPGNLEDINATSKAWISASPTDINLYSKDTNISELKTISVKIVRNGDTIAILSDIPKSGDTNATLKIRDFYIQFPYGSVKLPYIDGGDENGSVTVLQFEKYFKEYECDNNCSQDSLITSFGFHIKRVTNKQSLTGFISNGLQMKPLDQNSSLKIGFERGKVFAIKRFDANQTFTYLSFGYKAVDDNISKKFISKWIKITLKEGDGFTTQDISGDIQNGKRIFKQNCLACHRYNDDTTAPKDVAPMLTNIGGYGNIQFLRESLIKPNKTINPKFAKRLKNGKISPMPSFDWLSQEELNDLISYLKTLKATKNSSFQQKSKEENLTIENIDRNIGNFDLKPTLPAPK